MLKSAAAYKKALIHDYKQMEVDRLATLLQQDGKLGPAVGLSAPRLLNACGTVFVPQLQLGLVSVVHSCQVALAGIPASRQLTE